MMLQIIVLSSVWVNDVLWFNEEKHSNRILFHPAYPIIQSESAPSWNKFI